MPRQVLAWQCRFCGEIKKSEKIAARHEAACLANPDCRNCIVCKHEESSPGSKSVCGVRGVNCSRAVSANCEDFGRNDA